MELFAGSAKSVTFEMVLIEERQVDLKRFDLLGLLFRQK